MEFFWLRAQSRASAGVQEVRSRRSSIRPLLVLKRLRAKYQTRSTIKVSAAIEAISRQIMTQL
jgi:hypothetical protein